MTHQPHEGVDIAPTQEVEHGKGMPERVRRAPNACYAGPFPEPVDNLVQAPHGKGLAITIEEDMWLSSLPKSVAGDIAPQVEKRLLKEEALTPPLSRVHPTACHPGYHEYRHAYSLQIYSFTSIT